MWLLEQLEHIRNLFHFLWTRINKVIFCFLYTKWSCLLRFIFDQIDNLCRNHFETFLKNNLKIFYYKGFNLHSVFLVLEIASVLIPLLPCPRSFELPFLLPTSSPFIHKVLKCLIHRNIYQIVICKSPFDRFWYLFKNRFHLFLCLNSLKVISCNS